MFSEPKLVTKPPQPYAAMLLTLRQPDIAGVAPPLIADVIAWITARGGSVTGAPFFNYVTFFPDGTMQMQVGMPTANVLPGDDRISTGTLPGGTFASLTATAPYHELHDANMQLDHWAKTNGHALDGTVEGENFVGANRLEIYRSDPGEDPSGFPVTEIAFRLKQ